MLHIENNTHCLLWLLSALLANKKNLKTLEFPVVQELVSKFLEKAVIDQIKNHSLNRYFQLVVSYSEYLLSVEKAIFGIKALRTAIEKVRDSKEQITPIHREFAKLCLKAKCY
jgi:hypothetical protein